MQEGTRATNTDVRTLNEGKHTEGEQGDYTQVEKIRADNHKGGKSQRHEVKSKTRHGT